MGSSYPFEPAASRWPEAVTRNYQENSRKGSWEFAEFAQSLAKGETR